MSTAGTCHAAGPVPETSRRPAPDRFHTVDSDFLTYGAEGQGQQDAGAGSNMLTCLVVLNFNLPKATAAVWHKAAFRVCADGGTNRLYDGLPSMLDVSEAEATALRPSYVPQAIIGDLDSIREDVRAFYLGLGVPIHDQSHDQDSTDLMKCLAFLEETVLKPRARGEEQQAAAGEAGGRSSQAPASDGHRSNGAGANAPAAPASASTTSDGDPTSAGPGGELPPHRILVLGALGGRLDHMLSNLNTLYQYPHLNIVLWGDGNLVRLLRRGTSVVRPLRAREGPACGLVPLGGPAIASSAGLRWNLDNTLMQISGLISTCNVIDADEVWVTTDRELLWMTQVDD